MSSRPGRVIGLPLGAGGCCGPRHALGTTSQAVLVEAPEAISSRALPRNRLASSFQLSHPLLPAVTTAVSKEKLGCQWACCPAQGPEPRSSEVQTETNPVLIDFPGFQVQPILHKSSGPCWFSVHRDPGFPAQASCTRRSSLWATTPIPPSTGRSTVPPSAESLDDPNSEIRNSCFILSLGFLSWSVSYAMIRHPKPGMI